MASRVVHRPAISNSNPNPALGYDSMQYRNIPRPAEQSLVAIMDSNVAATNDVVISARNDLDALDLLTVSSVPSSAFEDMEVEEMLEYIAESDRASGSRTYLHVTPRFNLEVLPKLDFYDLIVLVPRLNCFREL
jgi:hypothetical protein